MAVFALTHVYFLVTYFPVLPVVTVHKNMVSYALPSLYLKQCTQVCHLLFKMAYVQLLLTCENTVQL